MIPLRVRIAGTGIICALGNGGAQVVRAIEDGRSGIAPLTRFKVPRPPVLPVGQTPDTDTSPGTTPTIELARTAADQAMAASDRPPDAIVMGITTGGMPVTEELLKQDCPDPDAYRHHGIGTAAQDLADRFGCHGPVLTVSTACSSGGCAIALAAAMIESGRYDRVLAGGADALCRLTYYGFKSLQLIDPEGSRPLDRDRRGMSVAEGAGMLLLERAPDDFQGTGILGTGLSCDAHHPAQPHPQGRGALSAMRSALEQAGVDPQGVDYINLHGTGTVDNDRSEAKAVNQLFNQAPPPLSSIKGATGHSLAASGAIEAVIAAHCVERGLLPANTGCRHIDPDLSVAPVTEPTRKSVSTVLSNSFGFGGNNAAVVIGRSRSGPQAPRAQVPQHPLFVAGWAAVSGAGLTDATIESLQNGRGCRGVLDSQILCQGLPPGVIRRIKRLSHTALALQNQLPIPEAGAQPKSVFFGTGWGSLSETHDFLASLFESDEKFSSPTDFIGSVHNAAAGQIALMAKATGANLTLSGGDASFEQALFSAQMLVRDDQPVMVLGADEGHEKLSPLFDPSVTADASLSDGGGALLLQRTPRSDSPSVELKYLAQPSGQRDGLRELVARLGGGQQARSRYRLILAGMPAAQRANAQKQLEQFLALSGYQGEVVDYRRMTGEYATASAVATVYAVSMLAGGRIPQPPKTPSSDTAVLVLGLGSTLSAIDVGMP